MAMKVDETPTEHILLANNRFPASTELHVKLRVILDPRVIRLSNAAGELGQPARQSSETYAAFLYSLTADGFTLCTSERLAIWKG